MTVAICELKTLQ